MAARKKSKAHELTSQPDPRTPVDRAAFLAAAQSVLAALEKDLLERARSSTRVQRELERLHAAEVESKRNAEPLEVWERAFITQIAAGWLLPCVFVRVLEDRGLLAQARIAGPGALDSQKLFFEQAPSLTERDYLLAVFRELTRVPATAALFEPKHSPIWLLGPSAEVAKQLLELFRAPKVEAPAFRFGQPDTRLLGDLYQDLSATVRERYALLQTPDFVESYILDRTLERAIARFGLDETTLIDPTCGSGHFLLGAFDRLIEHRLRSEPNLDVRTAAARALHAVYGTDINPYAVAIARFRLTLAYWDRAGFTRLAEAPEVPVHVAVADSLLHNFQQEQAGFKDLAGAEAEQWESSLYALGNPDAVRSVLGRQFAAVVGNPPYITVKDAALRERYRAMYPKAAAGKYSVAAPFTQRFFELARAGGFVGMITANSFMKREFGRKLIEQYLPSVNVDGIVNTSGAYIPGHGTPTVLLFGSAEPEKDSDVLAVLAKRGEPSTPEDAAQGHVWRSIADHGATEGFDNEYVSVARVTRDNLHKHPWSLGGGGAAELKELLESRADCRLNDICESVGFASFTGLDEAFIISEPAAKRHQLSDDVIRPMVAGEGVRDWSIATPEVAITPYHPAEQSVLPLAPEASWARFLWSYRTSLKAVLSFGGRTRGENGDDWWTWYRWQPERYRGWRIAFGEVATHNHFALDHGGKVFNRTAPIIKLQEGATEDDHLALLAYLNSSTACFLLKQVCMGKHMADGGAAHADPAFQRFQFDGTKLSAIPLPRELHSLAPFARHLLELVARRAQMFDDADREGDELSRQHEQLAAQMVAVQERIDFSVYKLFGLLDAVPPIPAAIAAGARPFEVELAYGSTPTEWFLRHDVDLPSPHSTRLSDMKLTPEVLLIEQPTYKRRWQLGDPQEQLAARHHLRVLESIESDFENYTAPMRVDLICNPLCPGPSQEAKPADIAAEAVPFLAALRHTDVGLQKRAAWERVWEHQRREDEGKAVPPMAPPPKYDQKDYRDVASWRLRGKLDVPQERFISYPGCESDHDGKPVYGWAGWNRLQQVQALTALYQERKSEGWAVERLTPMLAGVLELVPWLLQWHNDPNPDGIRAGEEFERYLDGELAELHLTRDDLRAWRPAPGARRGPRKGT